MMKPSLMMTATALLTLAATARALPTDAELTRALEDNPEWRMTQAESAVSDAEAGLKALSPHEWQTGGAFQQRRSAASGTYGEWSWRLERGLRLPGKGRLDRDLATSLREQAGLRAQAGQLGLKEEALGYWLDLAEAKARLALIRRQTDAVRALAAKTETLVRSGEVSRRELAQGQAELARLQVREAEAVGQEAMAEETLAHHYPALRRIADDRLPEPDAAPPEEAFLTDTLSGQPALRAAQAEVSGSRLARERADAERRADPVLGVFMSRESNPREQAVGISVSLPLGGERRRQQAAEAQARQALAEARQDVVRKSQEHALDVLNGEIRAGQAVWSQVQAARDRAAEAASMAERAWQAGEGEMVEAVQARRLALDAEETALLAKVRLLRAQAMLRLRGEAASAVGTTRP